MATATPKKKSTGNKVLYVPNPIKPNTSFKQAGPTPEEQKKNNPVTSKLVNNQSNLSQQQKVQKINTMNFGQNELKESLSQSLYNSGGVKNYIELQQPSKIQTSPKKLETVQKTNGFGIGFTPETKSAGYKTTGTAEIARKMDEKNIGNPSYTPPLREAVANSIEKYPQWFDPNSQTIRNADAKNKASNAAYVAKVNYIEPTVLSFQGTKVTLTPDQAKRYKDGELNTKFAVLRPNGEVIFAKSAKSAEKLRENQSTSFPKPEGFGIVPSTNNKKTTNQTKTNYNELMPFTTFESTGAKDVTVKSKSKSSQSQYIEPIEVALGFKELKANQNVSLGEKIGTGLALGAAGEFESFGNIGSTGERLATGKNELFGEWKERESAGTIGVNAFAGEILEGGWNILQSPFRSPEETVKKSSELLTRTKTQYDKAGSLIWQDPFTQIPTFVAPIASFIPETAFKTGKFLLQGIGKGASKATPQIVKDTAKQAKNILEDPFEIGKTGKTILPSKIKDATTLIEDTSLRTVKTPKTKSLNFQSLFKSVTDTKKYKKQADGTYRIDNTPEEVLFGSNKEPVFAGDKYLDSLKRNPTQKDMIKARVMNKRDKEVQEYLLKRNTEKRAEELVKKEFQNIFNEKPSQSSARRTGADKDYPADYEPSRTKGSESGVQDTSARGGNIITELFDTPKGKGTSILDDIPVSKPKDIPVGMLDDIPFNTGGKITKGAKRIYNSDYIFPVIGASAIATGYATSQLVPPKQEQVTDNKKLQKDQNKGILAFQGDYLLGYKENLETQRKQKEELNPFFGLIQSPYLDQKQPQIVEQKSYLGTLQTPALDSPFSPVFGNEEVPMQAPFLDQIPYQRRIGKGEFLFPPSKYNLFTDQPIFSSDNEGADKDFFRVFASAKEPFASTELPLGEFVDSDYPIFEIKDRLSGSQIRKANRFGGLQNPLRAPKNIIDEDNFVGLFGFNQNKRKRKSKEKSIFDIF